MEKTNFFKKVEEHLEKITGLSVDEIRKMSVEDYRTYIENKNKKKLSFDSEFPVIGRGNVLRDSLIGTDELNKEIDKILGIKIVQ